VHITEALDSDLHDVLHVERMAFGQDDEAELVRALMADPSARPLMSLLAREDERPVGHILFTAAHLEGVVDVSVSILAPLAVVPDAQGRGVGGALIARGVELLSQAGVDLVFVAGHPGYYPRHGFEPAGRLGLAAPYPIPEKDADAWMVRALAPGLIGSVSGKVICAEALDRPEYWRE
jgi:putative acetyltransferase